MAHDISSIRTCHSIFSGRCLFPKPLVESHLFIPYASLHGYQWLVRIFQYIKNINVGSLCKRRFNQLMVPYLSWSLLRYVISADYSIGNLSRIIIAPDSYFWFLWVLFWIKVIFILNQKIAAKYHMDEITTHWHHLPSAIRHPGWTQPPSFRLSIPGLLLSVLLSRICNA